MKRNRTTDTQEFAWFFKKIVIDCCVFEDCDMSFFFLKMKACCQGEVSKDFFWSRGLPANEGERHSDDTSLFNSNCTKCSS